ncbi:MAG: hypothetical protein ACI92W_001794 [Paraglaciecola sp.]
MCSLLWLQTYPSFGQSTDSLSVKIQPPVLVSDTLPISNTPDFKTIKADNARLGRSSTDTVSYFNPKDTLNTPANVLLAASSDTSRSTQRAARDIETTINYRAKDSIFFDLKDQSLKLYGDTYIDYGTITLSAARTDVNMYSKTINSAFIRDSTGRKKGRPIFSEGASVYETDNIVYNFETKRAQIRGVVTEQEGAFMHGDNVRKNEKDEMFIRSARYTTCDLAEPHFFIESEKLKVIPGNKIVSGPFNLRFGKVPTPLWFPFGMFPQPKQRVSGIIFPTYGEERLRGFFLREAGYYWAINEYIDMRLTGDIYTTGSIAANLTTNYRKRYKYSGAWNVSFNQNTFGELESLESSQDFWLRWNHRQDSRGTSSFSASVSLGTNGFNRNTNLASQDFNRSINSQFSSNVTYSKRFQGTPFNMTLNARQNQNLQTGIATLSAPELTLNTARQFPLKSLFKNANNPLAKLNFSHNFVAKNELSNGSSRVNLPFDYVGEGNVNNDTVDFWQDFDIVLRQGRAGGRHQIPVSTSIPFLKHFSLNPSFNYQEVWYMEELDFSWNPEQEAVQIDTINGFSRAGSWSSGASVNTIVYGTYFFKGKIAERVQAIRHVMTPSLSFSYSPDFGGVEQGVYSYVQSSADGDSTRVSKYQNFIYGSPTGQENRSLGFSLQNNLELKVRDKADSTGEGFKKIKIFDNLSFSTGYNFAADSFQLADISFSTRTSFFDNKLSLNFSGSIDPYQYDLLSESTSTTGNRVVTQQRVNRFSIQDGLGLGQVSRFSTSMNLNLRPKKSKDQQRSNGLNVDRTPQQGLDRGQQSFDNGFGAENLSDIEQAELEFVQQNPNQYVDFEIPWSLRMGYTVSQTRRGFQDAQIRQSFNFSGDLSLTKKTKVTFNSGYDFDRKTFTQTRIGINRDLHCWSLNFNWVPFGRMQSFSVVIQPKSSVLQDLKLQRRRSFTDFFL